LSDSDETLVRRYLRGEDQALSDLVDRHRNAVSRFVARRLGSRASWVDDVTQDVFVQVVRTARRFEGRSTFRTWLFGIALNLCRDCLRREHRLAQDDGFLAELPDASLDPFQRLAFRERAARVRAALRGLTRPQRLVLRLRDGENMRYEEIARVLAVPIGTVRSRLHNARAALAKALATATSRS
jgi:RNA polymerase sigma-70 factor (ECF subfamily)